MTAQEVADLFRALELDLVASLKRNMGRHIAQEQKEGGKNNVPEHWEAWQAAKLRDLRRFQTENRHIVARYAPRLDEETRQLLQEQYAEGGSEGFFAMNDRKVNALIGEMQAAHQTSQKAALRYMDDVYRQTIRKTALGMATGSMTLKQAVDDATKDFLRQGIQCIRYKNGRQVNIASYAEMALRTASTRATLQGEAALRETLGVDTVLVSQYGACSDTCLPWQGLVYIDDVFQVYNGPHTPGGTYGISRNGKQYPLLSVAMKAGLFHPNCRHTLTTWFEGISTRPKPMDKAKIQATSRLESKQRAMERRIRQAKREAEGLQDEQAAKEARREVRRLQKQLKAFVDTHGDVLRRDPWRERYDGVKAKNGRSAGENIDKSQATENLPKQIGQLPNMSDKTAKAFLAEVEKQTFDLEHEEDCTILTDGTVWRTKGTASEVHPEAIQTVFGKSLAGSYSYHNHPANKTHYSLSGEDAGFFLENEVQYSQASDDRYIYFMERTPQTVFARYEEVTVMFESIRKGPVMEMKFTGEIDPDLDEYHITMKLLAEEYGFRYGREVRRGR